MTLASGVAKEAGGFTGKGDWLLLKCFLNDGREFYFNINQKNGDAEIVPKDGEITLEIK